MTPRPTCKSCFTTLLLFALTCLISASVWAAPIIRLVGDDNGNFGQVGQWIIIDGENFDGGATSVWFSKSGGGTVASAEVMNSTGRGIVLCTVPATAVTGTVVVRIDGVDSAGYPFTVNAGTFTPGANTISGQVTASAVGVPNAAVLLLTEDACGGGSTFWDCTLTNGTGNYALNWPGSGQFMLFIFPPRNANLAGTVLPIMGSGNFTQNIALTAGTTVTGTVKNAGGTGIANAAVHWDGDAYDKVMTDATGNFSVHLSAGDWILSVDPPLNYHAMGIVEQAVTVPATSPYAMGNLTLPDGVWISGVLQDDLGAKIASAGLQVNPQGGGMSVSFGTSGIGGAFGMEVPLDTPLQLNIQTARTGPWVDSQSDIGPYSMDTNLGTITLVRAGFVTGVVQDEGGNPLDAVGLSVLHATSWTNLDWTDTCSDGTYVLKVPSGGTTVPVRVTTSFWNDSRPYATQVYNDKVFLCEGNVLDVSGTATVSGVNFALHPGGSISGKVSQYLGGSALSGVTVIADDGNTSCCSCSLGGWPPTDALGLYQIDHLPILPLRVWTPNVGPTYSRGSYTNKIYPQYTPVTPVAGTVTPNINIALSAPVSPKAVPNGTGGTQAAKLTKLNADGSQVQGTWDVTTCPPPTNHDYNLLVGVGSTLSSYGLVGSLCGLGRSGTFTGAAPAVPPTEKFLWFILVQSGGNGSTESSWGKNSANLERNGSSASNQCQYTTKDASGQCP